MATDVPWDRDDAEAQVRRLLEAAKQHGTQRVVDLDGTFEIRFLPRRTSLRQLLSKPGPMPDDVDI